MRAGLDSETDWRATARRGKVESWRGPKYRRRYCGMYSRQGARRGNAYQDAGSCRECRADAEDEDNDDGLVVGVLDGAIPLARCLEHLKTDAERQHRGDEQLADGSWHVAHHIIRGLEPFRMRSKPSTAAS